MIFNFAQYAFGMKYLKINCLISTMLVAMLLAACSANAPEPVINTAVSNEKPPSHGQVNQILVVSDSSLWAGPVGDTFLYYFDAPYILLPQPEPIFDLIHMTADQLAEKPLDKAFRNIIFLTDLNDENSTNSGLVTNDLGAGKLTEIQQEKKYNVTVGQDKWALNQQLFYINGFGKDKLTECIGTNFPAIARKINEREAEMVKSSAYQDGEDSELEKEVFTKFQLKMKIPKGFEAVKLNDNSNTLQLSSEGEHFANIVIHKLPYKDESQRTKAGIKKIRNEMCDIITSEFSDADMHIIDEDLPMFTEDINLNGINAVQARGIFWVRHTSGPFISNLLFNSNTNELIMVDAFLFDDRVGLRNTMQELELVLATASF